MTTTMQLDFSQAMSDFKIMFPDMECDVIEAVLRANQGAVDATIDQLLAMSTDNQNEQLRNELDGTDGKGIKPQLGVMIGESKDKFVSSPSKVTRIASNTGASPKIRKIAQNPVLADKSIDSNTPFASTSQRVLRRWEPPLLGPLPPMFLRISPSETRNEYDLPDEQFALMLQNEEFMNELRWNQEFMLALEKEQTNRLSDDADFRERLRHMGKKSRKKFLQLARVFTWQRTKKPNVVRHPESLLLEEEHSDDEDTRKPTASTKLSKK